MTIKIFKEEHCFSLRQSAGQIFDKDKLKREFTGFLNNENPESISFYSPEPQKALEYLMRFVERRQAAGGLVVNQADRLLVIKRFGKSDLPKGHIDPGENKRQTALRETHEECGIKASKIVRELPPSYHLFKIKNRDWILKEVFWFFMRYEGNSVPKPQNSENIIYAGWENKTEIIKKYDSFFPNLRHLIDFYLNKIE